MSVQSQTLVAALREAEASDESFRSAVSGPGSLGNCRAGEKRRVLAFDYFRKSLALNLQTSELEGIKER